jgi:hypothetical protein
MAKLKINPEFNTSLPNFVYDGGLWSQDGRPPSCWAVLLYALMIDKVTETYNAENGSKVGAVLGGTPVSYKDISDALHCSYSAVARAAGFLTGVGLIARQRCGLEDGYQWYVLNCRKEFEEKEKYEGAKLRGTGKKYYRIKPQEKPTEIPTFTEGELSIDHCSKCDGGLLECSCPLTCPVCSLALNGIAQAIAHIRSAHPEHIVNEESPTVDVEELADELA